MSRFTLTQADRVIVIGRCMRDYLRKNGIARQDIAVITNWVDEKNFLPVEKKANRFRTKLGLKNEFVVMYSGNMGVSHFFSDLLEVARRLRDFRDIKFILIGTGVRRKEIEKAKDRVGLKNIVLLPFQPFEKLSSSLSIADLHFVSLRKGFEGLVVPSKAYGAMAVGRAILYQGSEDGEIARMVVEEGIGVVVKPYDPDALEKAILEFYRDPALTARCGRKARDLALAHYSSTSALSKYYTLLCDNFR